MSCESCNFKCSTLAELNDHRDTCHGVRCTLCSVVLQTHSEIEEHVKTEHSHSCKSCNFTAKTLDNLQDHITKSHKCGKCGKLIPINEDLVSHKNMCGRSQCKLCNVNFVDENCLRIHTEEFHTFRCEHLDKVFGN